MKSIVLDIEKKTLSNSAFRHVLYTGQHAQLVVMSLKPKEAIGMEVHKVVDQFIRVESGEGELVLGGKKHSLTPGTAFVVPAGMKHNVVNTSPTKDLKLYTIYSPPHHKEGVVHKTKKQAESDTSDHP